MVMNAEEFTVWIERASELAEREAGEQSEQAFQAELSPEERTERQAAQAVLGKHSSVLETFRAARGG